MPTILQAKFARLAGSCYDRVFGYANKASQWLKLPLLFSKLERNLSKRPAVLGVELFVALSLTMSFFFMVRPTIHVAPDGNTISQQLFTYLSAHADPKEKQEIQLNWRKRLAGPMLSGWLLDLRFNGKPDFNGKEFENLFGFYQATWLFLLFLLLMLYRRDALLIMLGVFAGLMYYLSDPLYAQFYPWDLPTMFFFTLACLLYDSRRMGLLLAVVWMGALFKETTLCCALLILLGEHWPWRKRLAGFAGTVVGTLVTYQLLMWLFDMKAPIFAMNGAKSAHDLVWNSVMVSNIHTLFSLTPRHVLFANAGSLFILLLLPWRNRRDMVFKTLIVVFIVGEFFWGIINEFRIWYELLPLGWMIIADTVLQEHPGMQEAAALGNQGNRVLKGSYWLMMGTLLVLTLGVWVATKPAPQKPAQMSVQEMLFAASKGDVDAQYNLGRAYQSGFFGAQDIDQAANWYQKAAAQGYTEAQNALGMILVSYRHDYADAAQWFGRAATNGDAYAQYNLGVLYYDGLGMAQNEQAAADWYKKSAARGFVEAQKALGRAYFSGQGANQDHVAAYQWLKLAQLQGDEEAEKLLQACTASMSPEQIAAGEKLAREFKVADK
jgi:hypothetical protein